MNYKIIFRTAIVYTLSFLRRTQTQQQYIGRTIRRPLTILLVDIGGFILSTFLGYIVNKFLVIDEALLVIINEILIFVPSILIIMPIVYGVIFEFSQASSTSSTEAVNWMPITGQEYVLGSALSTIFILSPVISLLLGFTYGVIGIGRGLHLLWVSILLLSILALSGGAFLVEIIRAVLNRVSSAFYSRGGRSTIYIRFVISVIIFLIIVLLLNFNFLFFIIETYTIQISSAWYIPLLWPSLAIMAFVEMEVLRGILYGVLFLGFCVSIYFGSVKLRQMYWTPQPVSIKVTYAPYRPKKGLLDRIGYAQIEAALIRKDLRSLVRRKEMVRIVVAPLASTIIIVITLLTNPQMVYAPNGLSSLFFVMGPVLFGWLLGITSFGQEGEAMVNIYCLPITEKEVVKAKVSSSFFIALIALIVTLIFIYIVLPTSNQSIFLFAILSLILTIEATLIGVAAGAKYPDFRQLPRSRFLTMTGSVIGFIQLGSVMLIISLPVLFFYSIDLGLMGYIITLGSLILDGSVVCFVTYKIALKNTNELLESAQVM